MDSGSSGPLICKERIQKGSVIYTEGTIEWDNADGRFATYRKSVQSSPLPEFSITTKVRHNFHVMKKGIPGYDIIIGRNLIHQLKLYTFLALVKYYGMTMGRFS